MLVVHKEIQLLALNTRVNMGRNKIYNLGQKVGDKFTKLSQIGLSIECFTADFLQFFTKKRQNLA